ncbi:MAG: ATP-binding cassette domain-containing protein [bacterium]
MICVEHLEKHFGNVRAVDGVSFEVAAGEVVGLLGPNGAGKTTTMRIITGYLFADAGSVTVDGIPVGAESIEARRRIGYLPENAPLYTDLEVVEYLGYIARLRDIPANERKDRTDEMISTCGLEGVVGRMIGELSKGYRQRVGLAAAMIHRPPILILDEPTSGLDPNQIVEIRDLIREIGRERTVMLSTHILQEVEATCSRALIISAGKLVGHGTIRDLLNNSGRATQYTVTTRAQRQKIEAEIGKLAGLEIAEWLSGPTDERQRFILSGDGVDRAEEIFRWAASNDIPLSELARESASLEEVFRELTQQ